MVIYRRTKTGSLGNLHISGNGGFKQFFGIMFAQLVDHLHRKDQTVVMHGNQNTCHIQVLVVVLFDAANRKHQLRKSLKRKKFALHRNHNAVARRHGVHR